MRGECWSESVARSLDWRQKRVLATGATGFVGQHLARRLTTLGAQLYTASTSPIQEANSTPPAGGLPPRHLTFDVRNAQAVQEALRVARPDIVFHLAAVGVTEPGVDPMLALMINAAGVINLLDALWGSDVERVILVGTSYEYGTRGSTKRLDPFNAYSASKVAAWAFGQMYWQTRDLPVVTVRPFQVYGPGQPDHTLIPAAMRAALSDEDFRMTPGEQVRDFVFVEDLVEGMTTVAETAGIAGESLDLGTGVGRPILSIVERIWELVGAEGRIRPGARPYRSGTAMHLVADADRTARLSGWRAKTPLEEGLRITIDRLNSQGQRAP